MALVYISLGSNSDNKAEMLKKAIAFLASDLGEIVAKSSTYETEAWGYESTNTYYNSAVAVDSIHSPHNVLEITQSIEKQLGRINKTVNGEYTDRPIDIDILFYDDIIVDTERLNIPHIHICERRFVLQPLNDIAPKYIHPVNNKSIEFILSVCVDNTEITKTLL